MSVKSAGAVGFGAAKPGSTAAAIYLWGVVDNAQGAYRSDNDGKSWVRLTDATHQFATGREITGDPKRYGRVYIGTNGRGILVGDPIP